MLCEWRRAMNSTVVFPKEKDVKKKCVGFICVKGKSDKLSFLPLIMNHINIHVCGKSFDTKQREA